MHHICPIPSCKGLLVSPILSQCCRKLALPCETFSRQLFSVGFWTLKLLIKIELKWFQILVSCESFRYIWISANSFFSTKNITGNGGQQRTICWNSAGSNSAILTCVRFGMPMMWMEAGRWTGMSFFFSWRTFARYCTHYTVSIFFYWIKPFRNRLLPSKPRRSID